MRFRDVKKVCGIQVNAHIFYLLWLYIASALEHLEVASKHLVKLFLHSRIKPVFRSLFVNGIWVQNEDLKSAL